MGHVAITHGPELALNFEPGLLVDGRAAVSPGESGAKWWVLAILWWAERWWAETLAVAAMVSPCHDCFDCAGSNRCQWGQIDQNDRESAQALPLVPGLC